MSERLHRLIRLINKTGDKVVVFDDTNPDQCYVISSLDQYEQMVKESGGVKGLTEDELIDKINRDIAIWKSDQRQEQDFSNFPQEYEETPENPVSTAPEGWKPPKPEDSPQSSRNMWKIPESRRREAEHVS